MSAAARPGDRVVVTGGSGFLGSHVADALSDAGYRVVVLDATPSRFLRADQTMVVGDIGDSAALERAFAGARVVHHVAGIADIDDCNRDPARAAEVNVLGTVRVLEAAKRAGVERFVFSSSAYIYSRHGGFYRASKQAAEAFIETFAETGGPAFTILRYGSLYGRRADRRNRIYRMIEEALRDGRISFPGHADALREFIHVRDAARLSVAVLAPAYANKHVLITGFERVRIRDVAAMIREILMRDIAIEFAEGEPAGHYLLTPYNFRPDIAEKIVSESFVEFGHGLLDCIREQHDRLAGAGREALVNYPDLEG